jgi:hypothetical protein
LQLLPAAAGTFLQAGGDEQLHRGIGEDHRADVATVQYRATLPPEAALKRQQSRAHAGDCGHGGRGGVGLRATQVVPVQVGGDQGARRGLGGSRVGRIGPRVQHAPADRAIQQARVQVGQPERRRDAPSQRALAGRRRSVDGDDRPRRHGA